MVKKDGFELELEREKMDWAWSIMRSLNDYPTRQEALRPNAELNRL